MKIENNNFSIFNRNDIRKKAKQVLSEDKSSISMDIRATLKSIIDSKSYYIRNAQECD